MPLFHVSKLKKAQGEINNDEHVTQDQLKELIEDEATLIYKPEAILEVKQKKLRSVKIVLTYLIKWQGLDESHATWETKEALLNYPHLMLQVASFEDKALLEEGRVMDASQAT